MDTLLANQSRARLIASASPKSLNRDSLAWPVMPHAAGSYHSSRKVSQGAPPRLIAAIRAGTTNPSTDKICGRRQS
jgi:hypothetical protein